MKATTATSLRRHPWVLRWAGLFTRGGHAGDASLAWSALSAQATHWLLRCEDPDVPMARAITHLLAWGPRSIDALSEGARTTGRSLSP